MVEVYILYVALLCDFRGKLVLTDGAIMAQTLK
jgi:hypothetical protein